MKKKCKLTPQQKKLQQDFEKMMERHAKPLERGAKAKGVVRKTPPPAKKGLPLLESTRVNKEASLDTGYASTARKEDQRYTGDKALGVALMHKSNYQPVFNAEAAVDIAKMRRG